MACIPPCHAQARQEPAASVETIQGTGYIEPVSDTRRLVFESDGVIASCTVREGDKVKSNDVLMKLRDERQQAQCEVGKREYELALAERAKALSGVNQEQISAAEKRVDQMRQQVSYLRKESKRIAALVERNGAATAEKDKADNAQRQAEDQLKALEAELNGLVTYVRSEDRDLAECRVKVAEAHLECCKQELGKTELLAPTDGEILKILRHPGEGVNRLDPSPAIIMGDTSHLRATVEIDERYVSLLKVGQEATVTGRGFNKITATGRVTWIGAMMGKKSLLSGAANELRDLDVVEVWVELPADFSARVGLQIDASIVVAKSSP